MVHLSNTEAVILGLLTQHGELYGLEMVEKSEYLKRSSIYVLLSRLADKGLVKSKEVAPTDGEQGPKRRVYRILAKGSRVLTAWQQQQRAFFGVGLAEGGMAG